GQDALCRARRPRRAARHRLASPPRGGFEGHRRARRPLRRRDRDRHQKPGRGRRRHRPPGRPQRVADRHVLISDERVQRDESEREAVRTGAGTG
ncbi:MAG: hypothetical protein E5V54_21900, partial [Mesorhizobium sp.]